MVRFVYPLYGEANRGISLSESDLSPVQCTQFLHPAFTRRLHVEDMLLWKQRADPAPGKERAYRRNGDSED